jgi:hypothetical protein
MKSHVCQYRNLCQPAQQNSRDRLATLPNRYVIHEETDFEQVEYRLASMSEALF